MTARALSLIGFAQAFAAEVEADIRDIHPGCPAGDWLAELLDAAAEGDAAEVARLAHNVRAIIARELWWRVEGWATVHDDELRQHAHERAADACISLWPRGGDRPAPVAPPPPELLP